MSHIRRTRLIAVILVAGACVSAGPGGGPTTTRAGFINVFAFLTGYRISHYLELAVELQKLDPEPRAERLRQLALDPQHASEAYVVCRMLFEAPKGGEFRGPMIGNPMFADGGTSSDWPLYPITIQEGVPILIANAYALSGHPESPVRYFRYCQANCKWRDVKYQPFDAARVKKVVEAFITANPGLADSTDWVRGQGE